MKTIERICAIAAVVLILAVIWYAYAGQRLMTQRLFTNDRQIAAGTHWARSDKGLWGGPITALAADPLHPKILYAATKQDEWYTATDAGHRWDPTGGTSTGSYVVGAVVTGAAVGKAVYRAGFFLSQDGAHSWKRSSRGLTSTSFACMASAQEHPELLFLGTENAGIFRSENGGRSWEAVPGKGPGSNVTALRVMEDGQTVYAGTQQAGAWVSRDQGDHWTLLTADPLITSAITDVDASPADPRFLALSITDLGAALSADGGKTWLLADGLPSDCCAVAAGVGGAHGILIGTQSGDLWWSDGGTRWQRVLSLADGSVYGFLHLSGSVLAATSQGVLASTDGRSWTDSSSGITNLTLAAVTTAQGNTLYAATDAGVFRSADAGASWRLCSPRVTVHSVCTGKDGLVLAGTTKGTILRSTDSGAHWATIEKNVPGVDIRFLLSDPQRPGVFYEAGNGGFAISYDRGATWTTRTIGLVATSDAGSTAGQTQIEVTDLVPDSSQPGTIFLALTGQGIFRTTNDGGVWAPVTGQISSPWINSLALDRTHGLLYAGTVNSLLYRSGDRGASWQQCGRGLSAFLSVCGTVNTLLVTGDGTLYCGTELRGVAVSHDGGATFRRLNADLPDINVRKLQLIGSTIFAVTEHSLVQLAGQ